MPQKKTKSTKTPKARTKTKKLSTARSLNVAETKKVKGGVIAIIGQQGSPKMGDGSVRPGIQDGTSNTLLPYIEKK